ncbi:NfeD family protein [Serratia microhaemolytica]|uniref:NfeD family protein n=1 Tax=Serratia microhaemolytica TaxID=2675110 RepID=UPI000FDD86AB|nr:NfeD family protein [Serratia microhaemolytica]
MLDYIAVEPHWFWFSLGGLLLIFELLGAGGYSLWSGMSAILVGVIVWLFPITLVWQGIIFALLTLLSAYCLWYWLRKRQEKKPSTQPLLNQRYQQLVGRRVVLTEPTQNGIGRITIADGSWPVKIADDVPAGTEVEITAVDGILLHIRTVNSQH